MQVALIPPFTMMDMTPDTGYHLFLAHLLHRPVYRVSAQAAKGWKILDNGAAEGEMVDGYALIEAAATIGADEIVIPDVMGDAEASLKRVVDFAFVAGQHSEYEYMAVCQGERSAEFVDMAKLFSQSTWISSIALPRLITRISPTERYWVAEALAKDDDVFERFAGKVHCLGSGAFTREVVLLASCGLLRGVDTSMPYVMGMNGVRIAQSLAPYVARQPDYFNTVPTEAQKECVRDNIRTFLEWAGHSSTPPSEVE